MADREHEEWLRDELERKKRAEAGKVHYVHKPAKPEDDDAERKRRAEEEELKKKKIAAEEEEEDDVLEEEETGSGEV